MLMLHCILILSCMMQQVFGLPYCYGFVSGTIWFDVNVAGKNETTVINFCRSTFYFGSNSNTVLSGLATLPCRKTGSEWSLGNETEVNLCGCRFTAMQQLHQSVQNLTNTTLDSSVFSSSIEVDAILQNSFYTRPVKVFGKALHVEDAIETVYRLFQLHVGRTYQVNKTKIWTANCLYQAASRIINITACNDTSLMSAILPTLKNDIQDQVRCCQDYQQTQNIANCPAKEEIEDTCPTNYARGFLWEPTKVNVTIKSNRKESCKLFTSDIEPMDQNLHVHGHLSRTCTSNSQASSVWASVNGCKCFVTAMTDVLAKMKLTVAKQYTMHYLSTLTSFVRKYYKYNTDFNIATNAQELLSQSQQQQTDLQSIYYTEFTGCLAMTTMDLISNWHSDKNCPAPDSSKVAMNNTFYNALATLLNMPKEDVLSNPAYSLENNDTLTMAIQNISMMELGRSDPCPLVGTVIPLPAFKPGSGITSPNPTTATTPMNIITTSTSSTGTTSSSIGNYRQSLAIIYSLALLLWCSLLL